MVEIDVDKEEWYPVYEFETIDEEQRHFENVRQISEEKLEWLNKVFAEFREAQSYLKELYKNGK